MSRGATVLPNGVVLRTHQDPKHPDAPRAAELRPTGRTRRVLGRRLPVLTGYTGGTIPTHVEGCVRVGGPVAGFWVWLATSVPAFVAVLFAAAANNARAVLGICAAYVLVTAAAGSRVGPKARPGSGQKAYAKATRR